MTQKEILELEKGNFNKIFLFSEGMFWKAYERSAFNFVSRIKSFKPIRKYVAAVECDVVSIGFPTVSLPGLIPDASIVERTEKMLVAHADEISEENFVLWKESIVLSEPVPRQKVLDDPAPSQAPVPVQITAQPECLCREITRKLLRFNLESKTPIECMLLVTELKKIITNRNDSGDL